MRSPLTRVFALLSLLSVIIVASPAHAVTDAKASNRNTYDIVGLPRYLTYPSDFVILPNGTQPVCSISYGGTVATEDPYQFTADPDTLTTDGTTAIAHLCNGRSQRIPLVTGAAYNISARNVPNSGNPEPVVVSNSTGAPANVHVTFGVNKAVSDTPLPANGTVTVLIPTGPLNDQLGDSYSVVTVTGELGDGKTLRDDFYVTAGPGWVRYNYPAFTEPCSTVTWSYDPGHAPAGSDPNLMTSDIAGAFARLHQETGLTFTQVGTADESDIDFTWEDLTDTPYGKEVLGVGSVRGYVKVNNVSALNTDKYAGFTPASDGHPGRGWILIHETMHVLGFDHTSDMSQLMSPRITTGAHLAAGDLAGLHQTYPTANCPTR